MDAVAQVGQQQTGLIGGQIDFKGKDAVFHVRDKDHAVPDVDAPGALEHVLLLLGWDGVVVGDLDWIGGVAQVDHPQAVDVVGDVGKSI